MAFLERTAKLLAIAGLGLACSARAGDAPVDYTEEAERICTSLCEVTMACQEPPTFETMEACYEQCFGGPYIVDDTPCGDVVRDIYDCVGSTATCEEYEDSNNVHAEEYTCQAEKERLQEGLCD